MAVFKPNGNFLKFQSKPLEQCLLSWCTLAWSLYNKTTIWDLNLSAPSQPIIASPQVLWWPRNIDFIDKPTIRLLSNKRYNHFQDTIPASQDQGALILVDWNLYFIRISKGRNPLMIECKSLRICNLLPLFYLYITTTLSWHF